MPGKTKGKPLKDGPRRNAYWLEHSPQEFLRVYFFEPESAGVVTRLGRMAGFIVETTNVHPHPTLLQAFRHTDSCHTFAQVAHWADIQSSNIFSMKPGKLAIPLPKCNIVGEANMVRNLHEF